MSVDFEDGASRTDSDALKKENGFSEEHELSQPNATRPPQLKIAPATPISKRSGEEDGDRPPQTLGEPSSNGASESVNGEARSVNTAASPDEECDGQAQSQPMAASNESILSVGDPPTISPSNSMDLLESAPLAPADEAKRLFGLKGVSRKRVAEILGERPSAYTKEVGHLYMALFDFRKLSVVDALRALLERCSIIGETQAQERILQFFSQRYADCNDSISDADGVHSLTAAVMLLNQDLHGQNLGKKMTSVQFLRNVGLLREGQSPLSKSVVKEAYSQIKSKPLQFAVDGDEMSTGQAPGTGVIVLPNSVVEVDLDDFPVVLREGLLKRKNVAGGLGQRRWSLRHCIIRGFIFYMFKAEGRSSKAKPNFTDMHAAIILTHALARPAISYRKRLHAMQLTDSDGNYHLFQAAGYDDLMSWVIAINRAAAIYSSKPLAAPSGSSTAKFTRPVLPKHPAKSNPEEQLAYYKEKVDELVETLAQEQVSAKEYTTTLSKRPTRRRDTPYSFMSEELVRYQSYVEAMTLRHEFAPAAMRASDLLSPTQSLASMSSSTGSVSVMSIHKRMGGTQSSFHFSDESATEASCSPAASTHERPAAVSPQVAASGTMTPPPGASPLANLPGTRNSYREAMLQ